MSRLSDLTLAISMLPDAREDVRLAPTLAETLDIDAWPVRSSAIASWHGSCGTHKKRRSVWAYPDLSPAGRRERYLDNARAYLRMHREPEWQWQLTAWNLLSHRIASAYAIPHAILFGRAPSSSVM